MGDQTRKGTGGTPKWSPRTWEEEGRRGNGGQTGRVPLRGGWGRGGVPTLGRGPPMVRRSAGMKRDPRGIGGSRTGQHFPSHSGPRSLLRHPLAAPSLGPAPRLSPAPHSQGLFCLLFFFCCYGSVLPYFIYIFIFSNKYFIFLTLFFILCYSSAPFCLFPPFFSHTMWLAGSWLPGRGSRLSSCGGSVESKPLD